jgi:hypothetical protein
MSDLWPRTQTDLRHSRADTTTNGYMQSCQRSCSEWKERSTRCSLKQRRRNRSCRFAAGRTRVGGRCLHFATKYPNRLDEIILLGGSCLSTRAVELTIATTIPTDAVGYVSDRGRTSEPTYTFLQETWSRRTELWMCSPATPLELAADPKSSTCRSAYS